MRWWWETDHDATPDAVADAGEDEASGDADWLQNNREQAGDE